MFILSRAAAKKRADAARNYSLSLSGFYMRRRRTLVENLRPHIIFRGKKPAPSANKATRDLFQEFLGEQRNRPRLPPSLPRAFWALKVYAYAAVYKSPDSAQHFRRNITARRVYLCMYLIYMYMLGEKRVHSVARPSAIRGKPASEGTRRRRFRVYVYIQRSLALFYSGDFDLIAAAAPRRFRGEKN